MNQSKTLLELPVSLFQQFCTAYWNAEAKLPYTINILDELHGNENFHSRFLVKIWGLCVEENYPVLEHFLIYLKKPFSELKIDKPLLSAESDRIDARIRCTQFSVIVENKIHGAADQSNQIDRYIDIERAAGFADKDIYVLYLTRQGGSPSNQSLSEGNQIIFGNRIRNISFRSDILPWLNKVHNDLLPKLNITITKQLRPAVLQYTDHLHGLFFEREGEMIMKNEIIQFLKADLKLFGSQKASDNLRLINDSKELAAKLHTYLQELEDDTICSALKILNASLQQLNLPELGPIMSDKPFGEKYSSVMWRPKTWKSHFAIGFSFDERYSKLFYGIRDHNADRQGLTTNNVLQNELKGLFNQNDPNTAWPLGIWRLHHRIDAEFIAEIEDGRLMSEFIKIIFDILEKTKDLAELKAT